MPRLDNYVELTYWEDEEAWEIHFYIKGKLHVDFWGNPPLLLADTPEDLYKYIEDFRLKTKSL